MTAPKDIAFTETVFVRGYYLEISGMIYPGERGSDRLNAPGTPDTETEIEIDEIRKGNKVISFGDNFRSKWHSEIKAALIEKWRAENNG